MDKYERARRKETKEQWKLRKRARRYRKRMGLPDSAIVILMPDWFKSK